MWKKLIVKDSTTVLYITGGSLNLLVGLQSIREGDAFYAAVSFFVVGFCLSAWLFHGIVKMERRFADDWQRRANDNLEVQKLQVAIMESKHQQIAALKTKKFSMLPIPNFKICAVVGNKTATVLDLAIASIPLSEICRKNKLLFQYIYQLLLNLK